MKRIFEDVSNSDIILKSARIKLPSWGAWDQIGAIGDVPYSGQPLSIKVNALAINRPAHDANTKMYKIQYSSPAKNFDQMESTTFQPMLQSFKFA